MLLAQMAMCTNTHKSTTVQVQKKDKLKECLSAFMFLCALTCQLFFKEFKVGKQTLHDTPGDKHKTKLSQTHKYTAFQFSLWKNQFTTAASYC